MKQQTKKTLLLHGRIWYRKLLVFFSFAAIIVYFFVIHATSMIKSSSPPTPIIGLSILQKEDNNNSLFPSHRFRLFEHQPVDEEVDECKFPTLEPCGEDIIPLLKNNNNNTSSTCSKILEQSSGDGIVKNVFRIDRGTRILRRIPEYRNYTDECCYRPFYRVNDYFSARKAIRVEVDCIQISEEAIQLPEEHQFIEVDCKGLRKFSLAVVAVKRKVEDRIERLLDKKKKISLNKESSTKDQLNVVIFGIDATSRMNFLRMMPKSHSYLTQVLSAVVMKGYGKVGSNTIPNVIPLLTGLTLEEFSQAPCIQEDNKNYKYLDSCKKHFIWDSYWEGGYRTSLAEDFVTTTIFNGNWPYAFKEPPTHYYMRPFFVQTEKSINQTLKYQCVDERLGFEVLLENVESTAEAFGRNKNNNKKREMPYFQFTWAGRLAHEDFNLLSRGDEPLLRTLRFLHENGHLNNTALFLMGDHGARAGKIIQTRQGRLEDLAPLLYILLPSWFKTKYGNAWNNLISNQDKLVSPFDIHRTLLVLSDLETIQDGKIERNLKSKSYQSIFDKMYPNRSCQSAGIPIQWCPCLESINVEGDSDIDAIDAGKFVVRSINSFINDSLLCAELSLKGIVEARKSVFSKGGNINSGGGGGRMSINLVFVTTPGDAVFQSTVYRESVKEPWILTDQPDRLSRYKGQSDCGYIAIRPYCLCKDSKDYLNSILKDKVVS